MVIVQFLWGFRDPSCCGQCTCYIAHCIVHGYFLKKTLLISCNICEKLNHCHTAFASGDRNQAKMGSVFTPTFNGKPTHGPQTGAALRTQNGTSGGATIVYFLKNQNGPWLASSPSAGLPWQANGPGTGSSVLESVVSISSPLRCGPDAMRLRISGGPLTKYLLRRGNLPPDWVPPGQQLDRALVGADADAAAAAAASATAVAVAVAATIHFAAATTSKSGLATPSTASRSCCQAPLVKGVPC